MCGSYPVEGRDSEVKRRLGSPAASLLPFHMTSRPLKGRSPARLLTGTTAISRLKAYHRKLIPVQVAIFVDIAEIPNLFNTNPMSDPGPLPHSQVTNRRITTVSWGRRDPSRSHAAQDGGPSPTSPYLSQHV